MDHPHEPINAIKQWQEWYRTHAVVASMDEPLMSKDSRENLHDTSKAMYEMPDWRSFYKELAEVDIGPTEVDDNIYLQKTIEHFSDTLCEFAHELSAEQFYKAFLIAATNVAKSEDPPYEMKGKVTPTTGITLITVPMFRITWKESSAPTEGAYMPFK